MKGKFEKYKNLGAKKLKSVNSANNVPEFTKKKLFRKKKG